MANDLVNDLQEFLNGEDEATFLKGIDECTNKEELNFKYHIQDDAQANYYVKAYLKILAQEEKIHQLVQDEIDRVTHNCKTWEENELLKLCANKEFFKGQLEAYAKEQLKESKKKSLSLPEGVLSFRKSTPTYDYDEVEMVCYLKKHNPKYLQELTDYHIDKRAMKKGFALNEANQVTLDGQVVDFVTSTQKPDEFTIK